MKIKHRQALVAFGVGEEQDTAPNMAVGNEIAQTERWWMRLSILLPMRREAGWGAALATLVAAFFLGLAMQSNNGAGSSAGFQYLALALVALVLGVAFGTAGKPGSGADKVLHWLGGKGLGEGKNPYRMDFPNIYHLTYWWAPGLADNDWVHGGFTYPPLSLELSILGYLAWVEGGIVWGRRTCSFL